MCNPGYVEVVAGAAPSKDAVATAVSGLSVEWSALTVCVGPKRAEVLHGLTGRADRGALTAVLGPSGSGKSTLLVAISSRFERKVVVTGGSLRYDGAAWSRSAHKRRLAFVEQEDTLLGDLTVRQTLRRGGAPRRRDPARRRAVAALGLESCADQPIGGANIQREISGGQRRRVSIGHELLLDPDLVLLDEPTSGSDRRLDSFAAARLFQLLKTMVRDGRTVLATLHQPTDAMFYAFDELHLLLDGAAAYAGPADGAIDALCAKRARPRGTPCADHLLDVLCTGDFDAYAILFRRSWLAHRLDLIDPMFLANIGSITLLCAALWSGRAAVRPRTDASVEDTVGLLFLQPVYWGFQMMIQALFAFPPAHDVLVKERAAGLYSVSAFFCARTTVDTVSACLVSPLFALLYYFAVGLRPAKLPWHCLVLFCNGLAAQSAGLAIGASSSAAPYVDGGERRDVGDHTGLNVQVLQKPLYVDVLALLAFAAGFRVLSFVGLKRNT
ncbi:ATPase [Aureococcus anophagefferens]|nr:ATPase [Aureococcus anophagefferens]